MLATNWKSLRDNVNGHLWSETKWYQNETVSVSIATSCVVSVMGLCATSTQHFKTPTIFAARRTMPFANWKNFGIESLSYWDARVFCDVFALSVWHLFAMSFPLCLWFELVDFRHIFVYVVLIGTTANWLHRGVWGKYHFVVYFHNILSV